MLRTSLLTALLLAAPMSGSADDAVSSRIAPFVGPRTVLVFHANVGGVDVDALLDFLLVIDGPPVASDVPVRERPEVVKVRERIATLKESFLAAGIENLFAVVTWDDLPTPRPAIVIPVPNGTAVEPIVELIPRQRDQAVERIRGAIVLGTEEAVERMRALRPSNRADLLAALDAAGEAPFRLAVASGPAERRALGAMLPVAPGPLGRRYATLLAETEWIAAIGDIPRRPSIAFAMGSPERAREMRLLMSDAIEYGRSLEGFEERMPELDAALGVLRVRSAGERVTIDVRREEDLSVLLRMLRPKVERVTGAVMRDGRINSLKQLGLAMHNYADARKHLPPIGEPAVEGKPLLSWRVHMLPYLDQGELYAKFRLDEPWDSAHNKALLAEMPDVYRARTAANGMTTYLRPVAEGAIAKPTEGTKFQEIKDGTSNTMLVVDVGDELAVPWTKPADWEIDWDNPKRGLVPEGHDAFLVTFGDGAVHTFPADISVENLRAYVTMDGGEVPE